MGKQMTFYATLTILMGVLAQGCNDPKRTDAREDKPEANLTELMLAQLQWFNTPDTFDIVDRKLRITVDKGTDFFNNPEDSSIVASAPFLFKPVSGDFVAKTLVEPDFTSQWNALALMVHIDSLHWIKFAFENSDATGPSIVTVVTRGTSDDANGVPLNETDKLWLALVKKGTNYAMHWSLDNKDYTMARLTAMPKTDQVKIGVEAQSPVGNSATHTIHYFEVEKTTVGNLRSLD